MKPKKKSKVFTFIFSFLPGCAEMYMGFMKNGASILAVFFLSTFFVAVIGARNVFAVIPTFFYIYGFFHARNFAAMSEEEFSAFPDVCFWDELGAERYRASLSQKKLRTLGAVLLIFLGVSVLWNNMIGILHRFVPSGIWTAIDKVPSVILAIAFIVTGIILIRGKKKALTERGVSDDK